MSAARMSVLFSAILLAFGLSGQPAYAGEVAMEAYSTVESMSSELTRMRYQLEDFAVEAARDQAQIERAEEAKNDPSASPGDRAIAEERLRVAQRDALDHAMAKLATMAPFYQKGEESSRTQLKRLLRDPGNFESMVKGHLKGEANPVVLAGLVYLATKRLSVKCQMLYQQAVLGKVGWDLADLQSSIDLIDEVTGGDVADLDITGLMDELTSDNPLLVGGETGPIDDLDAMIGE